MITNMTRSSGPIPSLRVIDHAMVTIGLLIAIFLRQRKMFAKKTALNGLTLIVGFLIIPPLATSNERTEMAPIANTGQIT